MADAIQSSLRIPFVWELANRQVAKYLSDTTLIEIEGEFYYNNLKTDTKTKVVYGPRDPLIKVLATCNYYIRHIQDPYAKTGCNRCCDAPHILNSIYC